MASELIGKIKENRTRIENILFYVALTVEVLLMILEKSEISFGYESYVFRVTFLLTFAAVMIAPHGKKEWIAIGVILVFTGVCYVLSGKNDLLRLGFFLLAMRDIDLKKAMKYVFYLSAAGFSLIVFLSLIGVLGDISMTMDYGRHVVETRYVFGFGHPNTLFGCGYALFLSWLWLYGSTAGFIPYLLASVGMLGIAEMTASRTGSLVVIATLVLVFFARVMPRWVQKKWFYTAIGLVTPGLCVVLSIIAGALADRAYNLKYRDNPIDGKFWMLEEKINYRISNLFYSTEDRGGIISRWRLLAGKGQDSYFDMGWVRIVYWYGIIPAVIIIILIVIVLRQSYKARDLMAAIMVFSMGIYTLVEATFVTRYLGRDFFLLVAGVYIWDYCLKRKGENVGQT